jgi:hypothetical protein
MRAFVDIVCNPAALYPTLMLSYPDWCEAHRAMLRGASPLLADALPGCEWREPHPGSAGEPFYL